MIYGNMPLEGGFLKLNQREYVEILNQNEKIQKFIRPLIGGSEFINGTSGVPPLKNILVGMVFGLVFGFIDNAGMFFGMDALEPFLPREGFVAAGIGNTYSSVLGAFLAAFLSNVIKINTGVESFPVWSDAAGIVVGAILGIYVPPLIIDMF